ncbi:HEAT repeat domain-containing protein [Fundidesulfovibrio agrisoli]|uniref:HEAT repeat domain-containing protein n=1 Tax=Fundidesulfovibrio agrisoli TaxID=2922717 RepID=UPI001FAB7702|nr:HEAT repeat domain-containing protein [Fundidesulfovibrio agrisoli]
MGDHDELLRQLGSGDVELEREAAFAAGDKKVEEAVPHLARLVQSQNLGVQEAADRALRRIGGPVVVRAVAPLLRSDDPPARNIAMDVMREVGGQDFPTLVALLHDDDADMRIFASDILGSTDSLMAVDPLCEALLKDPEVNVRYQAAVSLGELGKSEAAKCLNKAMNDEEWVQFAVIEALAKIRDDSSVSALVGALSKSTDLVASMIVDALGEIGNVKAVAMLIKRLDESPAALRNKICKAVVKILGGKSLNLLSENDRTKFQEYLLAATSDEDQEIQDAAILGLGYVGGEKASGVVLGLAGSWDPDRDQDRIALAVNTLAGIGLTPALEEAILTGPQPQALVAVEAAEHIGGESVSGVLMGAFWERDRDVQRAIVTALLTMGGAEAVDFFLDVLERHEDGNVLKAALTFLGQKMREPRAADLLFGLLHHPYDDVKETALDACVALGGQEMVERFRVMAGSDDPLDRLMAIFALGRMDPEANLDTLKNALEDEIPDIRKIALEAVASMCSTDLDGLELLVSRLSDESREVRLAAVEQIGHCSLTEGNAYLIQALDDPDDWVRIRAMEALGMRMSADAVPKLVSLLDSPNKLLALRVIETLGEIGGKAAFRELLEILNSEDQELVEAAETAISRIQSEHGEDR